MRGFDGEIVRSPCETRERYVQRQMVADLQKRGPGMTGFTDPTTGAKLNLGQMFDRYAITLAVCEEFKIP